jgi:hexosaminidase
LLPISKNLNDLSEQLLLKINKKQSIEPSVLNELLEKCNSKEHADVELAVYNSLKKLVQA